MIIWILVETVVIQGFSWLQGIYFTTGVAELARVKLLRSPGGADGHVVTHANR